MIKVALITICFFSEPDIMWKERWLRKFEEGCNDGENGDDEEEVEHDGDGGQEDLHLPPRLPGRQPGPRCPHIPPCQVCLPIFLLSWKPSWIFLHPNSPPPSWVRSPFLAWPTFFPKRNANLDPAAFSSLLLQRFGFAILLLGSIIIHISNNCRAFLSLSSGTIKILRMHLFSGTLTWTSLIQYEQKRPVVCQKVGHHDQHHHYQVIFHHLTSCHVKCYMTCNHFTSLIFHHKKSIWHIIISALEAVGWNEVEGNRATKSRQSIEGDAAIGPQSVHCNAQRHLQLVPPTPHPPQQS